MLWKMITDNFDYSIQTKLYAMEDDNRELRLLNIDEIIWKIITYNLD